MDGIAYPGVPWGHSPEMLYLLPIAHFTSPFFVKGTFLNVIRKSERSNPGGGEPQTGYSLLWGTPSPPEPPAHKFVNYRRE
jgi:hypothetical protein